MNSKSRPGGGSDLLYIDIGCPLFIQCQNLPDRLKSKLIGLVPGAYIIVSTPGSPGSRPLLPPGTENIIVRYIFRGEVLGFKSSVLAAIEKPFRLTFLSYPYKVERMNLRKEKRINCNLPSVLTSKGKEIKGIISDLSSGGCRFTAKLTSPGAGTGLTVDSTANLSFYLPASEGAFEIEGMIRNSDLSAVRAELGVQFIKIAETQKDQIEAYIHRISEFV